MRTILLALLVAAPAAGQQSLAMNDENRSRSAMELELEAMKLHDSPAQYERAATLYLDAAVLRDPSDPMVVHDRRMAARLFFYMGDPERAWDTMESAGDAALRTGDLVEAAQAFLDAAWLAMHRSDIEQVERLAERAELLMVSPLVPEDQRAEVLGRIERRTGYLNVRRGLP